MSTISQGLYTLAKQGRNIVATSTSTAQDCVVEPDHPKWEKLQQYLDKGKLLSISAKGTWSGRKDYEGLVQLPISLYLLMAVLCQVVI